MQNLDGKVIFIDSIIYSEYHSSGNENINIGLESLANVLKAEKRMPVAVIGFNKLFLNGTVPYGKHANENVKAIGSYILKQKPSIVSFYTLYHSHDMAVAVAKYLKQQNSALKIILGGPHATIVAEETLSKYEFIDGVGLGEGEANIVSIIEYLQGYGNVKPNGFMYRENEVIKRSESSLMPDLDSLPMIDYSQYLEKGNSAIVSIECGRGCPFQCTFCSSKTFWGGKHRLKSPERIVSEIVKVHKDLGTMYFSLLHDHFTFNKQSTLKFCELLEAENLPITFECSSRIDNLDEDVIEALSRAGCKNILVGIETGSQHMQVAIRKQLKIEKIMPMVKLVHKHNIKIIASFIIGFPQETREDLEATLQLIHEMALQKVGKIFCNQLEFLPGTELFKQYMGGFELKESTPDELLGEQLTLEDATLFPKKFKYASEIRRQIEFIPTIVSFLYEDLYKSFPETYKLMIDAFGGSLLSLLMDIQETSRACLQTLDLQPTVGKIPTLITVLDDFFSKQHLDPSILAVYEVEKCVFLTKKKLNSTPQYLETTLDVIQFYKKKENLFNDIKKVYVVNQNSNNRISIDLLENSAAL